jgi:cell division protein ZapA
LAQVTIRINGYAYTLGCEDGQEPHLLNMASKVEDRIDSIKALGNQSGEARLLVLAALLMADELHDQSATIDHLRAEQANQGPASASEEAPKARRRLAALAEKAEAIAAKLEEKSGHLPLDPPAG